MSSIHSALPKTEHSLLLQKREAVGASAAKTIRQSVEEVHMVRPQDALLCNMNLPLRKVFYPLGFAVEIVTNDLDVFKAAEESFGHRRLCRGTTALRVHIGIVDSTNLQCPPRPTRREFEHLYSLVADVENQTLLDLKTGTSFAWLTKPSLNNRLYFRHNFLEKIVYLLLGGVCGYGCPRRLCQ